MDRLITFLATGCYSGFLPSIPGTWGSMAALLPWYFLRGLCLRSYLMVLAAMLIAGSLIGGSAEKIFDHADASQIVIDEFLGMFITLLLAPNHPLAWVLGLFLFRLFDTLKPFPASFFNDRIHGGFGIMMDDVAAGIYALCALQLIWFLGKRIF